MAKKVHVGPYGIWRDGRPRFQPGPRERALGFDNCDLRHGPTGPWFTFEEAREWLNAKQAEIAAARKDPNKRVQVQRPLPAAQRRVCDLWDAYTKSKAFLGAPEEGIKGLAKSTQQNYGCFIVPLKRELIWQAPVISITLDMVANEEKGLYRKIVKRNGLSMANMCMAAIAAAFTWGLKNGWGKFGNGTVMAHPFRGIGITSPPARLRIASEEELRALVAASDHTVVGGVALSAIGDAVLLGFYSGQRKNDLLELIDEGVDGNRMKLRQGKTGARVSIPRAPRLIERAKQARERRKQLGLKVEAQTVIVNEQTGLPYDSQLFYNHYNRVVQTAITGVVDGKATAEAAARGQNEPVWLVAPCKSLAISHNEDGTQSDKGFTFPDLRDSCVTWLARASCELPEIASITGHSLKSIYEILKHYLQIDEKLADSAIAKLLDYMEKKGLAV